MNWVNGWIESKEKGVSIIIVDTPSLHIYFNNLNATCCYTVVYVFTIPIVMESYLLILK